MRSATRLFSLCRCKDYPSSALLATTAITKTSAQASAWTVYPAEGTKSCCVRLSAAMGSTKYANSVKRHNTTLISFLPPWRGGINLFTLRRCIPVTEHKAQYRTFARSRRDTILTVFAIKTGNAESDYMVSNTQMLQLVALNCSDLLCEHKNFHFFFTAVDFYFHYILPARAWHEIWDLQGLSFTTKIRKKEIK